MSVSYDLFVDAFLDKITEYEFAKLFDFQREEIVDGYLKRAMSQFNKICKYDMLPGNDYKREFEINIVADELDEIVDIVSEGMCVQWLKPYFFKADNLENVLNTSDFSTYSPAELLYRITNAYKEAVKSFKNMMREYSFSHGDLTDFAL